MLSQYRVLARKYRPTKLNELVGQETLVRVLANAISSGRVAHGYLFTGIRGVGKTTTARIIARALNCAEGPTADPCGVCQHCTAILEDRHMDVLEMDAASRTGVGDVREIIENAKYLPSSARYKIYIIDEVHMLSSAAFNALLKTLEEPPPHVKFLFATTELRKIPITILSRCQRLDLKRVQPGRLAEHLMNICVKESVAADDEAISLIVRVSEGSVRDALSLLDQAIALGDGKVTKDSIISMLGLADRSRMFALLESIASGDAANAIRQVDELALDGADPAVVVGDLMELTAFITRFKFEQELAGDKSLPDFERKKAAELAAKIQISRLSMLWQALAKAYGEVKTAPNPSLSLQMAVVRLCHLSRLPDIGELLLNIESSEELTAQTAQKKSPPDSVVASCQLPVASEPVAPRPQPAEKISSFEQITKLFSEKREARLYNGLLNDVAVKSCASGCLELYEVNPLPDGFVKNIIANLNEWTGEKWEVKVMPALEAKVITLGETLKVKKAELEEQVKNDKLVQQVLESYPGAVVKKIKVSNM